MLVAWAGMGIYGFLLSYIYTGDTQMVQLSKKLANYFLNRLPEDAVCHWDLALVGTDAARFIFGGDCRLWSAGAD